MMIVFLSGTLCIPDNPKISFDQMLSMYTGMLVFIVLFYCCMLLLIATTKINLHKLKVNTHHNQ